MFLDKYIGRAWSILGIYEKFGDLFNENFEIYNFDERPNSHEVL